MSATLSPPRTRPAPAAARPATATATTTTATTTTAKTATANTAAATSIAATSVPASRRWYTLAVLCLSLLVIVVDTTIVNVALPTLARDLHAAASGLQWIVDAYTLTFAAILLLAGTLADRYGRHHALRGGLITFAAASLAAAFTHTTTELIAARAVMGIGAAFIMPATLSVISNVFTNPHERAKAIGLWSAVSGLGVAIGPVAGGWLLAHFSWSWIFLVNLAPVAIALVAGHWLVPSSKAPKARRIDKPGAALSVAALTALTYTLIEAPSAGWLSATTGVRAAISAAAIAAFVVSQARSDHPMMPVGFFANPRFAAASASVTLLFFALSGVVFLTTQVYQFVLGYSPLQAGLRSLPSAAVLAVISPLSARIAMRAGVRLPVTLGLITVTAGLAFYATAATSSGYVHYVIAMSALSAGVGLAMAPCTTAVMQAVPLAQAGVGSAVNDTTRNIGSVLGVAVLGSITASVFAARMSGAVHAVAAHIASAAGPAATSSIGAVAATAHRIPAAAAAPLLHSADAAFVAASSRAALAAAAATAIGAVVAFRALRSR
jgi:EmrB/QacA subfamily drug resistance transporter